MDTKFINPALTRILEKKKAHAKKILDEADMFCEDIKTAEKILKSYGRPDFRLMLEAEALEWDAETKRIVYESYQEKIKLPLISSKLKVRQRLNNQFELFFDGAMGE